MMTIEDYIRDHATVREMHGQCAWCTLVYDGEFAGMLLFHSKDGKLVPCKPETYSHGCCAECEPRVVERRRREKQRRRSTPREEAGVLYF